MSVSAIRLQEVVILEEPGVLNEERLDQGRPVNRDLHEPTQRRNPRFVGDVILEEEPISEEMAQDAQFDARIRRLAEAILRRHIQQRQNVNNAPEVRPITNIKFIDNSIHLLKQVFSTFILMLAILNVISFLALVL